MNEIDASNIDLNLLKTLDVMLAEQSVTRAAARLGVGQPAASHALARLRELFDDPLLVRVGREMVPTPRAEALLQPLRRLLRDAQELVRHETTFDPAKTTRTFVLLCPDLLAPLLPKTVAAISAAAPHAHIEMRLARGGLARDLEEGSADLALAPLPEKGLGLVQRKLGELTFAVVARRDHPGVGRRRTLSAKRWRAYPHVIVRRGHGGPAIVGGALAAKGFERRIGLVVPTFLAALVAVSETDFFFTVPRQLVRPLIDRLQLRIVEPPFELPMVAAAALWHERLSADPAHRFLRQIVIAELNAAM